MTITRKLVTTSLVLASLSACANFDLARAGHDVIKQANCEQTEARGACNRDWGDDYRAWQEQRAAYFQTIEAENMGNRAAGWLQPVNAADLPDL